MTTEPDGLPAIDRDLAPGVLASKHTGDAGRTNQKGG